jgi:hypothetical protein
VDKIFENKFTRKAKTEEPISPKANLNEKEFDSNDSNKTKKQYSLKYLNKEESIFKF